MNITWAGTEIANDTTLKPASGLVAEGQLVVDVVHLFRATNASVHNRGGKLTTIAFSVVRKFADEWSAVQFWATHFGVLATSGDLVFALGANSLTWAAKLAACSVQPPVGVSVRVSYTFQGPPPVVT